MNIINLLPNASQAWAISESVECIRASLEMTKFALYERNELPRLAPLKTEGVSDNVLWWTCVQEA